MDAPPPTIDPNALVTLLAKGGWTPIMALVVYVGVTFVKDSSRLPWMRVPAPVRPFMGTALALVASIALSVLTGIDVRTAFAQAATGVLCAILFHQGVVEGARDGKELPFPWLRPKVPAELVPPPPPREPSDPPVSGPRPPPLPPSA